MRAHQRAHFAAAFEEVEIVLQGMLSQVRNEMGSLSPTVLMDRGYSETAGLSVVFLRGCTLDSIVDGPPAEFGRLSIDRIASVSR